MPIKRSNIISSADPRRAYPWLGKIHKGAARTADDKASKRPGKDLDEQLRVEFEYNRLIPEADLREAWNTLYGDPTTVIPNAYLIGGTAEGCLPLVNEQWAETQAGRQKLIRICDGDCQLRHLVNGAVSHDPIPCIAPDCKCQQIGRLLLFLPDFVRMTGLRGVMVLQTHSESDIKNLHTVLRDVEARNGTIDNVAFVISRRAVNMNVQDTRKNKTTGKYEPTGESKTVVKWLLELNVDPDFAKRNSFRAAALPERTIDTVTGELLTDGKPALLGAGGQTGHVTVSPEAKRALIEEHGLTEDDFVENGGDEAPEAWTPDTLWTHVKDLFNHRRHFDNAIATYEFLKPDMTPASAEAALRLHRAVEGKSEARLFEDEKTRENFIGWAMDYVADDAALRAALEIAVDYPMAGAAGWRGCKLTAMAAVLAYGGGYEVSRITVPEMQDKHVQAVLVLLLVGLIGRYQALTVVDGAVVEAVQPE